MKLTNRRALVATVLSVAAILLSACSRAVVPTATGPPPRPSPTPTPARRETYQYTPEREHTAQQLQEDFEILRRTLEEAHPGLYQYTAKDAMDSLFDQAFAALDHDMTEIEFFRLVSPLIANIRCGHTIAGPSVDYVNTLNESHTLFPFSLRFIGGNAYVDEVFSPGSEITPGAQVLSINDTSMVDVIESLLPHVPRDANIETGQYYELGSKFFLYYAYFIEQPQSFAIRHRNPVQGEETTTVVQGVSLAHIVPDNDGSIERLHYHRSQSHPPLQFELLEEDAIAILSIGTFTAPDQLTDLLASSFDTLDQMAVQDLIIDLRGNQGGMEDLVTLLYAYLADTTFEYYDRLEVASDQPLTYREYTNRFKYLGPIVANDAGEFLISHRSGLDGPQEPKGNSFDGNVYLLIDGGSFSAAAEFSSIVHFNKRGVFIGEETGGAYYGNSSGPWFTLTLPNTGTRVVVPRVKYVMAVSDHPLDRGVIPDYEIVPSILDIIKGVDTQMEFTLDLIKQDG